MHLVFSAHALLFLSLAACDDHHKRVPQGFTGVRGKKSIPDTAYSVEVFNADNSLKNYDYPIPNTGPDTVLEKRVPMGFVGMRGKKPFQNIQPWNTGAYPDGVYKRGPSGFVGMRGKKNVDYGYEVKRAPSGFFGMRGKKLSSASYQPSNYLGDKRAPVGFLGMRGKKDLEETSLIDDKRAPSGFFGMRGKKQPSGFFGMRGKKYPYEFRGKFVGVRGKKSSNDIVGPDYYQNEIDLASLGEDLDINQLMLLLTEQNWDKAEQNVDRQ